MALFTDTRELSRQGKAVPFQKTTGARKTALAMLGYNDDGTKNTFGKYFGHGNVLLDHYVPKMIAQGDTKEVIDSAEGDAWAQQIASAKAAANFIGGGAGAGIGGLFGGGGGEKGTNTVGTEDTKEISSGSGSGIIDSIDSDNAMEQTRKDLEEDVNNSTILEDELENEKDKEGNKNLKDALGSSEAIPILGDFANAYMARLQMSDTLDAKKKDMMGRSTMNEFNYL